MEPAYQPVEAPTPSQPAQLNPKNSPKSSPKRPTRRHREHKPDVPSPKRSPLNRADKSHNLPAAEHTHKSHNGPSTSNAASNGASLTQEPVPSSSKQGMPSPSVGPGPETPLLKQLQQRDPPSPRRTPKKEFQPYMAKERSLQTEANGEPHQRPSWRPRRAIDQDQDAFKKVIITGFPAYTQVEDLLRVLSPFGIPKVEMTKNRMAVVRFSSELEAVAALRAHQEIVIYGEIVSVQKYTTRRHVADIIRSNRRVLNREDKGPELTAPADIDLTGDFYQQLKNVEDAIRLTQEEVSKIGQLYADIETVLKPIWPACRAVPFGSITTGLGIKSSDADCFLELEPGVGAGMHSGHFVRKATRALRMHPALFSQLVPIPTANTPIIKFLHVPTNVHCDLNSKTPLGAQNSRLIRHLLSSDARLGPLALLLKYWARVHGLSGTGRITNYALLMLLLFYLQRSILPPIARLQTPAHSFMVDHWEAGFDPAPLPPAADGGRVPVRDLLGGFFLYYNSFNFEELVACPLTGEPLKKTQFEGEDSDSKLPGELALYAQVVRARLARPLRTASCMCVQDPFELAHNVASSVTPRLFADLKAQITLAAAAYTRGDSTPGDFLRTALLERAPSPETAIDARTAFRISLPARMLAELKEPWRDLAREVVMDCVFRKMLNVEMERRDAVSREPEVEIEVYAGSVKRPVWRRGKHSNGRCSTADDIVARHAAITERLPDQPAQNVPIEVELGFRAEPRSLSITTSAMDGVDVDAYREFRKFAHGFIHRWTRELLKPHLKTPIWARAQDPQKKSKSRGKVESASLANAAQKDLGHSVAAISLADKELRPTECGET